MRVELYGCKQGTRKGITFPKTIFTTGSVVLNENDEEGSQKNSTQGISVLTGAWLVQLDKKKGVMKYSLP